MNNGKKILVAYFSWSGNTKAVAEEIHKQVGGDIAEIVPATPYSAITGIFTTPIKAAGRFCLSPAVVATTRNGASLPVSCMPVM